MRRWVLVFVAVALGAAAGAAHASTRLGAAVLAGCDRGVAVFEGRIAPLRGAAKAQLRFTLQARTPEEPRWRVVRVPGWGTWITAPKGTRYVYDKRVERLVAPGDYRAVVAFRWRDARGRTLRRERATSRVCHQPDPRPDLAVVALRADDRYVAVVANRGRGDAGAFTVAFMRNGQPLGAVAVPGLASRASTTVALTGVAACSPGDLIAVQADAGDAVDEADEDGNVLSVTCS